MKKILIGLFLSLALKFAYSQGYTVSGYVEDSQSGERLIGAIVYDANKPETKTMTNEFGYFSLKVSAKEVNLTVLYIGYEPYKQHLILSQDTMITVSLKLQNEIQEVVVTKQREEVKSSQMSTIEVPIKFMQSLPVLFGEVDLMKTLQLFPGVQSGTEGTSGIYVRGGGPDQNLILLDGVPVYNVNHLFGFFSIFNANSIKEVTVYKGGFPARYGGRLSSVIDVRMKDGDMNHYKGSISMGIISSKFTFEGPLKKGESSFIISARRTYIDLLAKPFIAAFGTQVNTGDNYREETGFSAGYYFYDLNAKFNYKIGKKDRFFLSLYSGSDKAYFKTDYKANYNRNDTVEENLSSGHSQLFWGNDLIALRWNHAFKKNLFMNNTITYSRFHFGITMQGNEKTLINGHQTDNQNFNVGYASGINDFAFNSDFDFKPNNFHRIRFGASAIYHTFLPGKVHLYLENTANNYLLDTAFGSTYLHAPEFALYIEDDFILTDWWKLNAGFRFSIFDVRDTTYYSPEPRLSMRFLLSPNFSLKLSYAQMMQYLHFLTNNTVGLPVDLWLPATDITVPEKSWQTALGMNWLIAENFNLSIEAFYKQMQNLIELKEGETIFSAPGEGSMGEVWEQKVVQGKGWSYGTELLLRKDLGKFRGWIAYTLSWSFRQFPDISFGNIFPYKYDRRHDLSIVMNYKFSNKIDASATWVFGSGTPITIPLQEYYPLDYVFLPYVGRIRDDQNRDIQGIRFFEYRNNYRLPPYHRLDISVNFHKEKKYGYRTWSLGLYNAYNHLNPFYADLVKDYDPQSNSLKTVLRVYSIFPILPFIAYRYVWK